MKMDYAKDWSGACALAPHPVSDTDPNFAGKTVHTIEIPYEITKYFSRTGDLNPLVDYITAYG